MSADPIHSQAAEQAWIRRKTWNMTWARSDTERWLDERSTAAAAWARSVGVQIRKGRDPKLMGLWLRFKLPGNFAFAHARLAKMTAEERALATPHAVLPTPPTKALESEHPFPPKS